MADLDYLGRLLVDIARMDRRLREDLPPSAPAGDGMPGVSRPGPKAPCNNWLLSDLLEAHDGLAGWAGNLATDTVGTFDVPDDDVARARGWIRGRHTTAASVCDWLLDNLSLLAARPWVGDMIPELEAIRDRLTDLSVPASREAVPAPVRELTDDVAARRVTGTQAEAVLGVLGVAVTSDQIRKWRERGKVSGVGKNRRGRVLYRVGDLLAVAGGGYQPGAGGAGG